MRDKKGRFLKGFAFNKEGYWKGKKQSKEHCEKKRLSAIKSGVGKWMKGKSLSKETKNKISEFQKGRVKSLETRLKLSISHKGSKHWSWKGGITKENEIIRNNIEYRLWREAVFARDNWTCQKTGIKGDKLHSHHIYNFSQYPELRFAIDNGITLSEKSHRKFHKKYGIKGNTKEQIEEFLEEDIIGIF